ncbi:hypothetical protein ACWD4G_03950 [Streptomyces sp. NPDC002643]
MGSLRLTLCVGAVVAGASSLSAPAVYAAESGGVSVLPGEPAPGTDVRVRVEGCGGRQGTAASAAFVADAQLTQLGGPSVGTLVGETRVRSSLRPGTYEVRVFCDGREGKVEGAIRVGDGKPSTARPSTSEPEPQSAAPASPVAPVRAGGGGAAEYLAANLGEPAATETTDSSDSADSSLIPLNSMDDARHTGPGTPHTVVGLVLAGVAAVVVIARGARRGRGNK